MEFKTLNYYLLLFIITMQSCKMQSVVGKHAFLSQKEASYTTVNLYGQIDNFDKPKIIENMNYYIGVGRMSYVESDSMVSRTIVPIGIRAENSFKEGSFQPYFSYDFSASLWKKKSLFVNLTPSVGLRYFIGYNHIIGVNAGYSINNVGKVFNRGLEISIIFSWKLNYN